MALIDEQPPITLPRAHSIGRSPICDSGSVKYIQSCCRLSNIRPQGEGNVAPRIAIPSTGLQQQNAAITIFTQPVGKGATGRARSDNDEVMGALIWHRPEMPC
jgi:hypothetical protein